MTAGGAARRGAHLSYSLPWSGVHTCNINVLQLTRAYLVLTIRVQMLNEGTYIEGTEVDIWGRAGGGGGVCRLVTSVVGK
jgi:hypothetical protein